MQNKPPKETANEAPWLGRFISHKRNGFYEFEIEDPAYIEIYQSRAKEISSIQDGKLIIMVPENIGDNMNFFDGGLVEISIIDNQLHFQIESETWDAMKNPQGITRH